MLLILQTFWRDKGLSGESVTVGGKSVVKNCSIGPLSVGFDFTSSQGSPALVTFIGGEQQIQYSAVSVSLFNIEFLMSQGDFGNI